MGFIKEAKPVFHQLYSEQLQKFRLAAQGHGEHQPPVNKRERIETHFDPLPFWYATFEDQLNSQEEYPLHAVTQRPAAMYHSWGSQNAWLRQLHGYNKLYLSKRLADQHALADGDWATLTSRAGTIKAPVKVMEGVNDKTVWTGTHRQTPGRLEPV